MGARGGLKPQQPLGASMGRILLGTGIRAPLFALRTFVGKWKFVGETKAEYGYLSIKKKEKVPRGRERKKCVHVKAERCRLAAKGLKKKSVPTDTVLKFQNFVSSIF